MTDIYRKRHITEENTPDKPIDLDTQYVRLKLLSDNTMGTMQRDALEHPDHYQVSLEEHRGTNIEDEDLVKKGEFQKYVLIRGRAGIGKSTLVQRLIWKWAKGEWACAFKVIFLLNLRSLITASRGMNLPHFLRHYPVYSLSKSNVLDATWLKENQGKIGLIFGKNYISPT